MILSKDEDASSLSVLLDELIEHEQQASEHYKALLETHPFSIPVLTGVLLDRYYYYYYYYYLLLLFINSY
jgi:hypothetical protein